MLILPEAPESHSQSSAWKERKTLATPIFSRVVGAGLNNYFRV